MTGQPSPVRASAQEPRTQFDFAVAQLRHAYHQLIGPDAAWDREQRMRFADGLIGPQIVKLEEYAAKEVPAALTAAEARGRQQAEQEHEAAFTEAQDAYVRDVAELRERVQQAEQARDAHIELLNNEIRRMVEAAAPFQVGGELYGVLTLGDSTVIDGMRWLFAQRVALTQALKDYGQHRPECHSLNIYSSKFGTGCSCGLDAALTGAQETTDAGS